MGDPGLVSDIHALLAAIDTGNTDVDTAVRIALLDTYNVVDGVCGDYIARCARLYVVDTASGDKRAEGITPAWVAVATDIFYHWTSGFSGRVTKPDTAACWVWDVDPHEFLDTGTVTSSFVSGCTCDGYTHNVSATQYVVRSGQTVCVLPQVADFICRYVAAMCTAERLLYGGPGVNVPPALEEKMTDEISSYIDLCITGKDVLSLIPPQQQHHSNPSTPPPPLVPTRGTTPPVTPEKKHAPHCIKGQPGTPVLLWDAAEASRWFGKVGADLPRVGSEHPLFL